MTGLSVHPHDGVLIRLLDGEPLDNDESAHVHTCPDCRTRLGTLETHGIRLAEAMRAAPDVDLMPPPDLWSRVVAAAAVSESRSSMITPPNPASAQTIRFRLPPHLVKAAALVGILMTGALFAQPVRDAVTAGVRRVVEAFRSPDQQILADDARDTGVIVGIVPTGDEVEVRLEHSQSAGTIKVIFEDRTDATGEILTQDTAASLLVLPNGFFARNEGARDWSYVFRVSSQLKAVRVVVAGITVRVVTADDQAAEISATAPH